MRNVERQIILSDLCKEETRIMRKVEMQLKALKLCH